MGRLMRFAQGEKSLQRMADGAARARSGAEETLELLRTGRVEIEGHVIDFVVRAPIAGHVIQLDVEDGQPVVPASSYGTGTVLAVLADMAHPVFRGTVDEIDVGRLREGMGATVEIGALPGSALSGTLSEIALRATQRGSATVFAVELDVTPPEGLTLRAGYSAVARIALERAEDVLVLPERVVEYRGGEAFVLVEDTSGGAGGAREQRVEVGVSDGLVVEVRGGLTEGARVLER
jgi:HlyD family secretion protein